MKMPLTGGAYTARSVIASAQRAVNLVAEPLPQSQGEPAPMAHFPTAGLRVLSTVGPGPIRGIYQVTTGGVYVVSGSGVYRVDATSWAGTHLGDITYGLITPVSMSDNGNDMVIVDGSGGGWIVTLTTDAFTPIPATQVQTPVTAAGTAAITAGVARYTPFTATQAGVIATASITLAADYAGKLQAALFSSTGSAPADKLGIANTIVNPHVGANTLTFGTPVPVTKGTQYWLGVDSDTTAGSWSVASGTTGASSNTPYHDFPQAWPGATPAAAVVCQLTVSNDPDGVFAGADKVDYLDTFFVFNKPKTPQFYITGSLAVTFDSLDFANKQMHSDLLVTLIVAKRDIYLLGERTTEIWYDVGASNVAAQSFQFAPLQSTFIDHGCVAKYSVASADNAVFWLTRDRQGQGVVMQAAGYQTKRASTFAIENEIASYARIDDAIGMCYQMAGHTFYVLAFPHADKTWVYDIDVGLWHEWVWIDSNGDEHRHRANAIWPCNNTLVVGDWQNGTLYALDRNVYTDNGKPIKRLRSFPHLLANGNRVYYRQFLADLETGTSSQVAPGSLTLIDATFSAADDTALESYTSDVGGGWTALDGPDTAQIVGGQLVGTGGDALYQSAASMPTADYAVQFTARPSAYDAVVAATTLWAIGRATGAGTGYRVSVTGDGTQYTLALDVLPSGASASVAMGTLSGGAYTVWLRMRGTSISAQAQRSEDGLFLRDDGTWLAGSGVTAAQLVDGTYTGPGSVQIGGTWP